ncbi:SGNH/GDSL hydrolase family protein [Psychrobacter arenosus]|uniref:SGNH/GDSL hydrolase family protein n=1 Tax=Psychrobacter arenosus TaxID=256326 RepID=UPI00191A0FE1|nr:SGNH/GDSL hydrolase family protein [Psychrobacter arenosus]
MADMKDGVLKIERALENADVFDIQVGGDDQATWTAPSGETGFSFNNAVRKLFENGGLPATLFDTYEEMLESDVAEGGYAVVTLDELAGNNGLWQKKSGTWVYANYNTQQLVNRINNTISPEFQGLALVDSLGFQVGEITEQHVNFFELFDLSPNTRSGITDELGFVVGDSPPDLTQLLSAVKAETSNLAAITDELGFVIGEALEKAPDVADKITISEPLFVKNLCAFPDEPVTVDIPSLIKERALQYKTRQVTATLAGAYNTELLANLASSSHCITIQANTLPTNCYLTLRDAHQVGQVRIPVKISTPISAKTAKVLMIGDSITNRGLADMCHKILADRGHTITFLGTMKGASLSAATASDEAGKLGEGREGWETGDYTFAVNDRARAIPLGEEAIYLAANKDTQWPQNPFLRAAEAGDSPEIVRNGYVFDPAFYQTRFSLDTPDIIVIQLGTNDIRDRDQPTLVQGWVSNTTLMINQIKAAWPQVKIILSIPNTAHDTKRNNIWENEYHPLIRAMLAMQSIPNVLVCPCWALMASESGFLMTTSTGAAKVSTEDPITGALIGEYADPVHPSYTPKYQMAHAISAYIACI